MASKNLRLLPKSSKEPAFAIVLKFLIFVAILQFLAAFFVLAPRLVSTAASQFAMRSKASDTASIKKTETMMIEGTRNKSISSLLKSPDNFLDKSTLSQKTIMRGPSSAGAENGLQSGASLSIINIQHTAGADGDQILKIAIKSRLHEVISVPDVKVQVYFYDQQGEEIVTSKAPVASRWLSPPVDWKDAEPELLEVTYQPDNSNADAHYVGYIVAIYYKGELQGYKADPVDLTIKFPIKVYIGASEV